MARSLVSDRSGSVLPLFALTIGTIAVLLSAILTHGLQYLEDRRMQALADLIALLSARDQDYSNEFALAVIEDQGLNPLGFAPRLTPGHYVADIDLAPLQRFTPHQRPYNAVRVDLHARLADESGVAQAAHLLAEAAAARRDTVSFSVGSRLVRVEDGASGDVLAALLGYDGRITAMDYSDLADLRIDSLGYLDALAGGTRLRAVTYEEMLDAQLPPEALIDALIAVSGESTPGVLDRIAGQALPGAHRVRVGDVLGASAVQGQPVLAGGTGASLSALDLVEATAMAARSDHQVALDLDARLAALNLAIGERPQSPPIDAASLPGTRAETRQLDLLTRIRLGLQTLDVRLQAAEASSELVRVRCGPGGRVRAEFDVETRPARLIVEDAGLLGRALEVDLGSGERQRVTMTDSHIRSGAPVTLRSGLGAEADLLGLSLPVAGLVDEIVNEVDGLATDLGIRLAEADLYLRDASCGRPFLIE